MLFKIGGRSSNKAPIHRLFDASFYRQFYEDLRELNDAEQWAHFLKYGWREGRLPNPAFDCHYYLEQHPELRLGRTHPLDHYLELTSLSPPGPSTHPLFDPHYYLSHNPGIKLGEQSPLEHFLTVGWKLDYNPHPLFDTRHYRERAQLGPSPSDNPLGHFLIHGTRTSLSPTPYFDAKYYRSRYDDLEAGSTHPLLHYLERGWKERRLPHPDFPLEAYLLRHPSARMENPLVHYARQIGDGAGAPSALHPFSLRGAFWGEAFNRARPPAVIGVAEAAPRINAFLDLDCASSLSASSSLALWLAAGACGETIPLRIITRGRPADPSLVHRFFQSARLEHQPEVHFHCEPLGARGTAPQLELGTGDRFICSHWTLAQAALRSRQRGVVVLALAEWSALATRNGDESLLRGATLHDPDLHLFCPWESPPSELEHELSAEKRPAPTRVDFPVLHPRRNTESGDRLVIHANPENPGGAFMHGVRAVDEMLQRESGCPASGGIVLMGPKPPSLLLSGDRLTESCHPAHYFEVCEALAKATVLFVPSLKPGPGWLVRLGLRMGLRVLAPSGCALPGAGHSGSFHALPDHPRDWSAALEEVLAGAGTSEDGGSGATGDPLADTEAPDVDANLKKLLFPDA